MTYPCQKCGLCCRVVPKMLGWPTEADGRCVYLTDENTCSIYENRPDACRVENFKPAGWSDEKYHKRYAEICERMRELWRE